METLVRTPRDVFMLPQRLLVPLFQRPYVWNEENQWRLLWDDVRRQAEVRLESPGTEGNHFLGAIVLQHSKSPGLLPQRTIIDGQQRLTTLQLLLDAAHAALTEAGEVGSAAWLTDLTTNAEKFTSAPEDQFKVWPTNRDRAAYNEVMAAAIPVDYEALEHRKSLIVQAHAYFSGVAQVWLAAAGSEQVGPRGAQLVQTLMTGIQLVVIDLDTNEDSQEIFETLNARGTPLTAADLIKNLVFQRLASDGGDTEQAYRDYWALFETEFWEKQLSVGRYPVARSSLFLNQWLVARTGEEVSPRATFSRFKHYVEREMSGSILGLLQVLNKQALQYQSWVVDAARRDGDLDPTTMAVYRTQATGLELLKPILLWLHEPGLDVPDAARQQVVRVVESWLMRRSLLRLPSGDLGRVVADLIRAHRDTDPALAGERVSAYLARLDSMSTYWPGDDEIRQTLTDLAAYRRYPRTRLRMYLEAAEDHDRGYAGTGHALAHARVRRDALNIEHVLPQRWRQHWPVADPAAEIARDAHVHLLGNLTLLTGSLNSVVSNGPWNGPDGKRTHLHTNDVLLLNRWIVDSGTDAWNEELIDARTERVVVSLLDTWRVPEGHHGQVKDRGEAEPSWVELKDLIAAGLLQPGQMLRARAGDHEGTTATVLPDGRLRVGDRDFTSPSGAGHHLRHRATNGWHFWVLDDGRRLNDVRAEFRRQLAAE